MGICISLLSTILFRFREFFSGAVATCCCESFSGNTTFSTWAQPLRHVRSCLSAKSDPPEEQFFRERIEKGLFRKNRSSGRGKSGPPEEQFFPEAPFQGVFPDEVFFRWDQFSFYASCTSVIWGILHVPSPYIRTT